jgi:predicted nucleic acid-binding protein
MKYVLDASVAVSWVLKRPHTPEALRLRQDFQNQIHELIAPSIFPVEVVSALTKSERQRIIVVGEARRHLENILTTPPAFHPYEPLLLRATDISSQTRSGLNDCLYVALAEREACQLVTDDQKLLNALGGRFPFLVDLATLP